MSAPSLTPDQPGSEQDQAAPEQDQPGQNPSGKKNGFRELGKLVKWSAMAGGILATLGIGIVIGNLSRKRLDRMSHGY
jgi:hypothetical protein